ncbi:MAG: phosphoenolpyruvate synthase regulatory protein [Betaproteobacteria bacterium RIFCSPLOWO2_02_FULL_65_24]|nr:MAG: phosphoenolpyruvate synthase regulatory protein [Betaproteobacteria bacterium RIFCSPLOWO2_02_FULL_65_24]OGA87136.1 MAG: phosphoenolpyruvate synthase regulatory protein [Betaproteobacteria bacterium RIFCSPLOWO2_12_FULL_66_14]
MPDQRRTIFIVSDGTGITAEMLGHSLLTQFEGIAFNQVTIPFVDSIEKAESCVARISESARSSPSRPIIFSTLVNNDIRDTVRKANAYMLDFFEGFLDPLEAELGAKSTHTVGRSHSAMNAKNYSNRINAVNFSMAHDDGMAAREFDKADVILIGVSRSGKTPTSLYLALQFGIRAANYPLTPDDFEREVMPEVLVPNRRKLFGLTIQPERLREIRHERRPGSRYASLENCRYEVQQAEALMKRDGVRWVNSTTKSIEEIATTVVQEFRLERTVY